MFTNPPQCAHLLNVPSVWFMNWLDDGSMNRNVLPDLYIDNKTICCVPTEYGNIYLIFILEHFVYFVN